MNTKKILNIALFILIVLGPLLVMAQPAPPPPPPPPVGVPIDGGLLLLLGGLAAYGTKKYMNK